MNWQAASLPHLTIHQAQSFDEFLYFPAELSHINISFICDGNAVRPSCATYVGG